MKEFNIDNYLDNFAPYFLSLRKVEGYLIIDIEVPLSWDVGKVVKELIPNHEKVQTILTEQTDQTKMIAIVGSEKYHTYDLLFTRLDKIIKVNKEREQKNKLFRETVKKLEQLFINNNLEQLQNLVINVGEKQNNNEETELNNGDEIKIDTLSKISNELNDKVL